MQCDTEVLGLLAVLVCVLAALYFVAVRLIEKWEDEL